MSNTWMKRLLTCVVACAVPLAAAQNYQETQKLYDEQRRQRQETQREEQRKREQDLNDEAALRSIQRDGERNSPTQSGGGGGSDLLAGLLFIVGGTLILGMSQTRSQPSMSAEDQHRLNLQRTLRQRQGFIYGHCKAIRQKTLVQPVYNKPNNWKIVRIFQSDRAEEYKIALAEYQTATAETEPACKCVGERSISSEGFSEPEWKSIADLGRTERPWANLEESRVKGAFGVCAAKSPSDPELSWLYAGPNR